MRIRRSRLLLVFYILKAIFSERRIVGYIFPNLAAFILMIIYRIDLIVCIARAPTLKHVTQGCDVGPPTLGMNLCSLRWVL